MKLMHLLAGSLTLLLAFTQNAVAQITSGTITYEAMVRIDPSAIRIVMNGNIVKPGSPDAPPVPDVRPFSQKLIFAGNYAREVREAPAMMMRHLEGPGGGGGPGPAVCRPFYRDPVL